MSGGGGHIILKNTQVTLTDPLVSGQLPAYLQQYIDPFINNDPATWTVQDKFAAATAYGWALCNCQ